MGELVDEVICLSDVRRAVLSPIRVEELFVGDVASSQIGNLV